MHHMRLVRVLIVSTLAVFMPTAAVLGQVPEIANAVGLMTEPLEIEGGDVRTQQVSVPPLGADDVSVLWVRARIPMGGGGNFCMRVTIDGDPLRDSWFKPRLLNKAPFFDPPGTEYHFAWYRDAWPGNFGYTWFTVFSAKPDGNWAGTGQDFDYLFSLDGLVRGGSFELGIEHTFPGLAAALKVDRAPLLIERLQIGSLPRTEVERLQEAAWGGIEIEDCPVNPAVPEGETGEVAYELEWSGKPEPPAQVSFDNLAGWTCRAMGSSTVTLSASVAQRLWRPSVGKLTLSPAEDTSRIIIAPPSPISIAEGFDAANLWVHGHLHFMSPDYSPIAARAVLEDADGNEVAINLGEIRMGYWMLLHGYLPEKLREGLTWPVAFKALLLDCNKPKTDYACYLESIHFYERNRRPVSFPRPDDAVFPVRGTGMLPTAPDGVEVRVAPIPDGARFVSTAGGRRLVYDVSPANGCLQGVSARWAQGRVLHPCDGGGILPESGPQRVSGELRSTSIEGDHLLAEWQNAAGQRWSADYSLAGRTLVVDLRTEGNWSAGTTFGELAGLSDPRGLEVPYLMLNHGKPQAWTAVGDGIFVSVLPCIYSSDYSSVSPEATPPHDGRIGLLRQTNYVQLTDGTRNPLRDRLLITVSDEFADVLPNHDNPPSPNRERLAPYMFVMDRTMNVTRWDTFKRYGLDHIIANDFAGIFVRNYSEGFGSRWRPHPGLTIEQVQQAREKIKSLGFLYGGYNDVTDFYPLNEFFDEDRICLKPDGDLADAWPGSFSPKPDYWPTLMRSVGEKVHEHYPPDCVYLDVSTNRGPAAIDYEAGVPGAGMARSTLIGNGDSLVEARRWYGSTISEGIFRWMFAGLCDMDYAQLRMSETMPLPLDFDLLKLHPYQHGTMMGYSPNTLLSPDELKDLHAGQKPASVPFYKYVATSLAYGHMLLIGYGYFPPMSAITQYYALMQGPQQEYLTDTVAKINYHDGERFLPTSQALQTDAHKLGRVRVVYSRGMTVTVNLNPEQEWTVSQDGGDYVLPPYGWVITKPGEMLAYSATVDGSRHDYVQCPDYYYLNTGDTRMRVGPLEVQGAAWLKEQDDGWLLIPCGHLGWWAADHTLKDIPADRGCPVLIVDLPALKAEGAQISALGEMGETVEARTELLEDGRLSIKATAETRAYLITEG